MESSIIFSETNMAGAHIMLILLPILPDPMTGMRRCGLRGINKIPFTTKLLRKGIPIGTDTVPVIAMTRISIIGIIMARGRGGIKDSMAVAAVTCGEAAMSLKAAVAVTCGEVTATLKEAAAVTCGEAAMSLKAVVAVPSVKAMAVVLSAMAIT
jgi:hypothetical protein